MGLASGLKRKIRSEFEGLSSFERLKRIVARISDDKCFKVSQVDFWFNHLELNVLISECLKNGVIKVESRTPLIYRLVETNVCIGDFKNHRPLTESNRPSIKLKVADPSKPKTKHSDYTLNQIEEKKRRNELIKNILEELKSSGTPIQFSEFKQRIPSLSYTSFRRSDSYPEFKKLRKESLQSAKNPKGSKTSRNKKNSKSSFTAKCQQLKEQQAKALGSTLEYFKLKNKSFTREEFCKKSGVPITTFRCKFPEYYRQFLELKTSLSYSTDKAVQERAESTFQSLVETGKPFGFVRWAQLTGIGRKRLARYEHLVKKYEEYMNQFES